MALEKYVSPEPGDLEEDLLMVQATVEQLKTRFGREYDELPEEYDGVIVQALQAPNFYIALQEAMPHCGFETVTRCAVGGEGGRSMLWANSSASKRHIGKVRKLGIAVWKHPMQRMLANASCGSLSFRITRQGAMESSHCEAEELAQDMLPRAFLTSHLVAHIRGNRIYPQHTAYFEALRKTGHTPLGFEEMGGLAIRVLRDTLSDNPELLPD